MLNKKDISKILDKMTDSYEKNIRIIFNNLGNLSYRDGDNQTLLHILVDNLYDEDKCFLAIASLLNAGLNPNSEADFNYNFIQTALYTGYSEEFIIKIIREALKYNLNVNHVDSDKDTIMHTAIYSDDYVDGIINIYNLLIENGFNAGAIDYEGRNLLQAMIFQSEDFFKKYSKVRFTPNQIERFKVIFEQAVPRINTDIKKDVPVVLEVNKVNALDIVSKSDIFELEKYGRILNKKKFISSPTVGREKELKSLMITLAQEKKKPLLVGESGVGKTAIVDELAYRMINGEVPSFLQGKLILEVTPSEIVAGCQYVGQFEEKMTKLMNLCERLDVILFIDEIHTIYGVGSTKNKDNDMASILKYYIDRTNLKVIGTTTTKEYNEFFSNDALKRRFERIQVNEPTKEVMFEIIEKVITDYCFKNGIYFENNNLKQLVINVILDATDKKHRVFNDMVNNPDLAISIIDKAFAFAKIYDCSFIGKEHFIESFELNDRIYDSAKETAISKLRSFDDGKKEETSKIFRIDFNRRRPTTDK